MIETVTQIWQRLLRKPSIGVDENFFSLGGNLRSADLLFAEITLQLGRELPSATIYHAQTIARLAALLEQPTLPRFSPLVEVKPGSGHPPVLIVHGLAGTVPFFELAQHIQTGNPVYGFQAKGVDGIEEPLASIETMAAFYLDSLRNLQPHGPYCLIGYSFGGLVTLEMAQRLTERGEKVSLLVLVDAYPDPRYLASGPRMLLAVKRAKRFLLGGNHRVKRAFRYLGRSLPDRLLSRQAHSGGDPAPSASRLSFSYTTLRVKEKAYEALAGYRPRYYPGEIRFIKSGSDSYFPSDPVAVWAKLAAGFKVDKVRGGHLDLVTTDFAGLGAVLTRYLKESPGCQSTNTTG